MLTYLDCLMVSGAVVRSQDGDGEDAERLAISDEDFKKRRAHPSYKENLSCERAVSAVLELDVQPVLPLFI